MLSCLTHVLGVLLQLRPARAGYDQPCVSPLRLRSLALLLFPSIRCQLCFYVNQSHNNNMKKATCLRLATDVLGLSLAEGIKRIRKLDIRARETLVVNAPKHHPEFQNHERLSTRQILRSLRRWHLRVSFLPRAAAKGRETHYYPALHYPWSATLTRFFSAIRILPKTYPQAKKQNQ